ncbi:MAG: glutamine synthetase [Bryobacteraceae bacterium]|nr:glutamine synthetase [Bryobacteraceae bacterium]
MSSHVKVGVFDLDGILRGKYLSRDKFESAAQSGLGFCDVIFGWDCADAVYDNVRYTGPHTGYPDAFARIDLSTKRQIPWEEATDLYLLDMFTAAGERLPLAPRSVLQRVVDSVSRAGYEARMAAEFEFWLFEETPQTIAEKNYTGLKNLSPGMFGYSLLRTSAQAPLMHDLLDQMAAFDVELEGLHTETGPGGFEAAITVDTALAAADKAALFKTAAKEIALRDGLMACFMAKWNAALPGSGGHVHQSLWDSTTRQNIFVRPDGSIADPMRHYIAGLLEHLPELMVLYCPTVNSYKRMVPGAWAPVNATWGVDNRTVAVRALPGGVKSGRVEMRVPGADMNPYLTMAASLAAGLDGVTRRLSPPEPITNGYKTGVGRPLPSNLLEATWLFRESAFARKAFGDEFVEHYAATREWEWRQYEKSVTAWELERYFEVI